MFNRRHLTPRFGPPAPTLTIHNRTDLTCITTITIETAPLGLTDPGSVSISDIAISEALPFSLANGDIVLPLMLGPRQTRVLQVR